ncbi:MAG: cytochrome b5 domain-containing protein [Bacillota bacterium]|nr:cytochrome b5 domain-containing protein [Bacillota bacterium]
MEELAQYDGLEGRKAYIAVDGVVYDVTEIPQWKDGFHQGRFQAGKDYSAEIRSESPHGLSMLSRAEKVGVLAE